MSRIIHSPLNQALEGLETAAQEVATQCWQWDQLARELFEEFRDRYNPEREETRWMGAYLNRLARYGSEPEQLD